MSRLIAWVDNGSWSHAAVYAGEGRLLEMLTSGSCERPIAVYRSPNFRVGLYRLQLKDGDGTKVIDVLRSRLGFKYSYKKALIAGLQKMLGIKRTHATPNDELMRSGIRLIAIV